MLLYLGLAWITGIFLASFGSPPPLPAFGAAATIASAALLSHRLRLLALALLILFAGAERYWTSLPKSDARQLSSYNGQGTFAFEAIVSSEPEYRERSTRLRLQAERLLVEGEWQPVEGEALATVRRFPEYRYGDRLLVIGNLEEPPEFDDFSYRDYLARQGLRSTLSFPKVTLLERDRGSPRLAALYQLKERLQRALRETLPEPQAALLVGMVLGNRTDISPEVLDAFTVTGTLHLIAISGMNIAIVAGLLFGMIGFLLGRRRALALMLVIVGLALYTAVAGASPSVMRAFIMGSLALVALHLGRPGDALNGLALAASLMTLQNPQLLWDVAFQLSFLATAGLVLLAPPLEQRFRGLPGWASTSVAITIAAQIATFPIVAANFSYISLVALPANLMAVPALSGIMLWGLLTAVVGSIWDRAAFLPGAIAWLYGTYLIQVAELWARLPFAAVTAFRFPPWLGWLYYGAILAAVGYGSIPMQRAALALKRFGERIPAEAFLLLLTLVAVVSTFLALAPRPQEVRVAFLDVGQGDAILVQTPFGHDILIDGGPSGTSLTRGLGRRMAFWNKDIELMVLTHPEEDHVAGLMDAADRFRVRLVLDPDLPEETAVSARWLELLRLRDLPRVIAQAGQRVELGQGVWLDVLQAGGVASKEQVNEGSLIMRLVAGPTSILLTGDATINAQRRLLAAGAAVDSDILKVPHHGAADALDPTFLQMVSPGAAIISVGRQNRYGHPAPETLRALEGIPVYRTDLQGSVEVAIGADGYTIATSR